MTFLETITLGILIIMTHSSLNINPQNPSTSTDPATLAAEALAMVATNGVPPLGESAPQPGRNVFDELANFDGDTKSLQAFALDAVPVLAEMDRAGRERFYLELIESGLSMNWIRRSLQPAANEQSRATQGVTWVDYVRTANELGYEFRLNILDDTPEVNGKRMSDVTEATILSKMHAQGFNNVDVARRAFLTDAAQNQFHPVKSYLENLTWDGQDHIAHLSTYFRDSHDPITYADGNTRTAFHAFMRRWLVGAVAKLYDPMANQNPVLILDGAQGRGKSHFVSWLASSLPKFFIESPILPDKNDSLGLLVTKWIWEAGELGSTLRRQDREALKLFITLGEATWRPPYGRYALQKPALASFIGTANNEGGLLSDPTGHRRFRPVELLDIDWGYSKNVDVDQLWAQAYALYLRGERATLTDEEGAAHKTIVESYEVEDVLEGYFDKGFEIDPDNAEWFTTTTKIIDTLLFVDAPKRQAQSARAIASTMKKLGLRQGKRGKLNASGKMKQQRGYVGLTPRVADE